MTGHSDRAALLAACDRICGVHVKRHRDRCPLYLANCAWMDAYNRRSRHENAR